MVGDRVSRPGDGERQLRRGLCDAQGDDLRPPGERSRLTVLLPRALLGPSLSKVSLM